MKTLQSNFTTPEQSKRLLELGLPSWTADCFYKLDLYSFKIEICFTKEDSLICEYIPRWSVGRLIEIFEICTQHKFKRVQQTDDLVYLSPIEDVLMQIEHNACGFYDNTKWEINLLNK